MANPGEVHWLELNTWDAEGARAFYSDILGWHFEHLPINKEGTPPYWIAKRGGETVCGVFGLRSPDFDGVPSHWLSYFAVDDIAQVVAEIRASGGKVYRDPLPIPCHGTIAIVADPSGAAFGLIQSDASSGG